MKLSYGQRAAMPKADFAVPAKRQGGKGGYPVPDKAHAKAALARASEFGTPAVKAQVRAKVEQKFPSMAVKPASPEGKKGARGPNETRHPSSHDEFLKLGA